MEYVKLKWFHDIETEPCIIYSEISDQRYEVRKIEVYKSGVCVKCDENMIGSQAILADVPFPTDFDVINQDKQFYITYINKEEFERIWNNG